MTKSEIRAALRKTFGARKYRITSTGEIHVSWCGFGWCLYGWMGDSETIARIESLA